MKTKWLAHIYMYLYIDNNQNNVTLVTDSIYYGGYSSHIELWII